MSKTSELQALREDAVFVDSEDRDFACATGNDRVSFLHRITSGRIAGVAVGQGGRTLLLDARGHVLSSLLAFVRAESVRLVVAAGQGAHVAAALAKYAIMDDFRIAPEAELASVAVLGPKAASAVAALDIAPLPDLAATPLFGHRDVVSERFGPLWLAHGRRCGADGLCVAVNRESRDGLVRALLAAGARRLSADVAEAARIAALEPAAGKEIKPDRFPVEVGLGGALDHGKGCYVGQETIVRMRDRGTVRKRLVLLRLAGEDTPGVGDAVAAQGQLAAGQITSAGCLPGEAPVALAILASAVPVVATVQVQHAGAALPAQVAAEAPPWG
jgi:folate-binding protein YgfZ